LIPSRTTSDGFSQSPLHQLFEAANHVWSIGANSTETVFDFGEREAEVAAAKAAYRSAVATYRGSGGLFLENGGLIEENPPFGSAGRRQNVLKAEAMADEPQRLQRSDQNADGAAILGRHAGAADQILGQRDRIDDRRHGC